MNLDVYTDGGARGNPGPAGFGLVINSGSDTLFQQSQFLGIKTNNEAEYLGFIAALNWIRDNITRYPIKSIRFHSDSQLMVRQMQGVYKVKAGNIRPLYNQAQDLLSRINLPVQFNHVPRGQNQLADKLANVAMDSRTP